MNITESCLPAPSEAYPLIREGREAGAGSAVEWEGNSWACVWGRNIIVPGGESPDSIARGGDGWSEGLSVSGTLALPADSGSSLHLSSLGMGRGVRNGIEAWR